MAAGVTSLPIPSPAITATRYVEVIDSPQAEEPPPQEAERQPYREMEHGDYEPDAPPRRLRQIAGAEDDWRRAGPIVRRRGIEAGEEPEAEHGDERRCAEADGRGEKGGKHRGHVRDEAGEGVVRIEIDDEQDH